jgi:hypothetical protein
MNELQTRKQLLIAESELNRVEMLGDIAMLGSGFRALADRAKSFSAIIASTAALVAGFAALRRGKTVDAAAKPSWLQKTLRAASLVSSLWLAFRPRPRDK